MVSNVPGGPYPASAVLTTSSQPLQSTADVVVVKLAYVVAVLPAERTGWTTSVVAHPAAAAAAGLLLRMASAAASSAAALGVVAAGKAALVRFTAPADDWQIVLQEVLGMPARSVALMLWLGQ